MIRPFFRLEISVAVFIFPLLAARADIRLPDLFADHMVLQRDQEIPIWGTAAPAAEIRAEFAGHAVTTKTAADGRWNLKLPALPAGGPLDLKLSGDGEIVLREVLLGDVWLASGQSNLTFRMQPNRPWSEGVPDYEKELAAAHDPGLRFFTVVVEASHQPKAEASGSWLACTPEHARFFSAVSYYFARRLREDTGVPVGVIVAGRGGTSIKSWMSRESLDHFPELKGKLAADDRAVEKWADAIQATAERLPAYRETFKRALITDGKVPSFPDPFPNYDTRPAYLCNAMIAPLARTPVRGFIWYQGESDSQSASSYPALFQELILSWRAQWQDPDAPFLFVQLANYDPVKARGLDAAKFGHAWAEQRAAQASALKLPQTAMAVAADVGDPLAIHPRDKRTVGERLGRAALAMVYGKAVPYRGPRIESAAKNGSEVVLSFTLEKGSLTGKTAELTGFELAAADGVFQPAQARLDGNRVIVSAASVRNPTRVRYAWANNPRLSLYDSNGLPSPPFEQAIR